MRRSYVVPMRWMVMYEYEVPGGALNLSSTKLPRPWSPWKSFPSRKTPHDRTGNRTRNLMISSRKLCTLDHEAGFIYKYFVLNFTLIGKWRLIAKLKIATSQRLRGGMEFWALILRVTFGTIRTADLSNFSQGNSLIVIYVTGWF
jgi:hypothetical protein